MEITVPETISRQLHESMLDDKDLIDGIRLVEPVAVPERPGHYRCSCLVAVRRPLDPETAELRKLTVGLKRVEETWEVLEVDGLEPLP